VPLIEIVKRDSIDDKEREVLKSGVYYYRPANWKLGLLGEELKRPYDPKNTWARWQKRAKSEWFLSVRLEKVECGVYFANVFAAYRSCIRKSEEGNWWETAQGQEEDSKEEGVKKSRRVAGEYLVRPDCEGVHNRIMLLRKMCQLSILYIYSFFTTFVPTPRNLEGIALVFSINVGKRKVA